MHPVEKTALDQKMMATFDGLDELYQHAKFREDRSTRAGCRLENMVFVCFFLLVCHASSLALCSFEVVYFEEVLCHGLWVDFDTVYIIF